MKAVNRFFDTNVLLYLLSDDSRKADQAEAIIATGGVISVQVLNEFASVASRKLKMSYAEIREFLSVVRAVCQVQDLTLAVHEQGLAVAEQYGFSLYDSMIVSAALAADCSMLYSEDMQHGQAVGSLVITNPFL
ncbi:PIN domain-containing protein [Methylomonas sp. MgM2]